MELTFHLNRGEHIYIYIYIGHYIIYVYWLKRNGDVLPKDCFLKQECKYYTHKNTRQNYSEIQKFLFIVTVLILTTHLYVFLLQGLTNVPKLQQPRQNSSHRKVDKSSFVFKTQNSDATTNRRPGFVNCCLKLYYLSEIFGNPPPN